MSDLREKIEKAVEDHRSKCCGLAIRAACDPHKPGEEIRAELDQADKDLIDAILPLILKERGVSLLTQWQPIETAPKGVEVLLYEPDIKTGRMLLPARVVVSTYPTHYPRKATYWQPLPPPPSLTQGDEA